MSDRLRGVFAPVLTPFRANLAPDPERFEHHCRWLLNSGVGLVPFGTTSEANSLAMGERMELLEHLVSGGLDPAAMLVGTGCCSLTETVHLTAHAVRLGCAGVLTLPPFYYKDVSDEGLFRHFAAVIERVADARLRLYLYHIPPTSRVRISTGLIARLLDAYPQQVAGIKDSSGEWANTQALLDAVRGTDFRVFTGSETDLLRNLRGGGAGCITATANVNPRAIVEAFRDWQTPRAEALQERIEVVRGIFQHYPLIAALKYTMAHWCDDPAWLTLRPPLVELTEEDGRALLADLTSADFTITGQAAS